VARLLRRGLNASDGKLAVDTNANRILDEADQAYTDFLTAAHELVHSGVEEDLAPEEPTDSRDPLAALNEVDSLDLDRQHVSTIIWATGYAVTSAGSCYRCSTSLADRFSSGA
jgi:hypothetical protein